MSVSPRQELLRLQKRLYRRYKSIIEQSVVIQEPGFAAYQRRYRRAVAQYQRVSGDRAMLAAVSKADIVYVGDYHTCAQSQRSFLRMLKAVIRRKRPIVMGLELIHRRHQGMLDDCMQERLSEEEFVHAIGLRQHWVFDLWPNFKPLFDFAKYHHVPMIGIDAAKRGSELQERDQATGKLLAKISVQYPDHLLFAFIGDLHIAPQHLPRETTIALHACHVEREHLILYQNSEAIHWKLAAKGLEHKTSVVQIDAKSFCRMHTPPLICQQSYLNWLEHEEGEIDYADAKEQFIHLVDQLGIFLGLHLGAEKDHVTIYTCGDLSFLDLLKRRKAFTPHTLRIIRDHVMNAESYFIPQHRMVYLANLSINHASEEAAHYIKYLLCGPEQSRPLVDAFYANVLHEALGFFGSKVMNPKRKCFHVPDFRRLRRYFLELPFVPDDRAMEWETTQLVLEYKKYEMQGKPLAFEPIFHQSPELFFAATHAVGYMLGELLFYGVMSRKIGKAAIRELFQDPWKKEGEAITTYMQLLKRLQEVKIPKRM